MKLLHHSYSTNGDPLASPFDNDDDDDDEKKN